MPRTAFTRIPPVDGTSVTDRYRTEPSVRINGESVDLQPDGRFVARVDDPGVERLAVEMSDSHGRAVSAEVGVPQLAIRSPSGLQTTEANVGDCESLECGSNTNCSRLHRVCT